MYRSEGPFDEVYFENVGAVRRFLLTRCGSPDLADELKLSYRAAESVLRRARVALRAELDTEGALRPTG